MCRQAKNRVVVTHIWRQFRCRSMNISANTKIHLYCISLTQYWRYNSAFFTFNRDIFAHFDTLNLTRIILINVRCICDYILKKLLGCNNYLGIFFDIFWQPLKYVTIHAHRIIRKYINFFEMNGLFHWKTEESFFVMYATVLFFHKSFDFLSL